MENNKRILDVRISLGSKFQLHTRVSWTKLAQKGCFWSKIKKVSITVELCILELV